MKKLTKEWIRAAQDDLDVISRIINEEHLSHIVAFHAQQCVEKLFKALAEEHGVEIRKIHNLVRLYGKIEIFLEKELDLSLLKTLDSLYIEARYPSEFGLLPNGRPTIDNAVQFYAYASDMFKKVNEKLLSGRVMS